MLSLNLFTAVSFRQCWLFTGFENSRASAQSVTFCVHSLIIRGVRRMRYKIVSQLVVMMVAMCLVFPSNADDDREAVKQKRIRDYEAHPYAGLMRELSARKSQRVYGSIKLTWDGPGGQYSNFQMPYRGSPETSCGIAYDTTGMLRIDLEFKSGTLQTFDALQDRSFELWTPAGARLYDAKSDIPHFSESFTGVSYVGELAQTRWSQLFWPYTLQFYHHRGTIGFGGVDLFKATENNSDIFDLDLFPGRDDKWKVQVDDAGIQVLEYTNTGKTFDLPHYHIVFKNELVSGVYLPIEANLQIGDKETIDYEITWGEWGGRLPYAEKPQIRNGTFVNDQDAQSVYLAGGGSLEKDATERMENQVQELVAGVGETQVGTSGLKSKSRNNMLWFLVLLSVAVIGAAVYFVRTRKE
jgi:hypothetical protein